MGVSSYLEFVTTLFAWVLYKGIWAVLVDTGIVFIPIITMVLGNILSSRKAGDDEGSAAIQSLKKIETDFFAMLAVIVFAAIPAFDVTLAEMEYVKPALSCSAVPETIDGDDTGTTFDRPLLELGAQTGGIPVWWGFVHVLSKAVTAGSIAAIPCTADLASVEYRLANDAIDDPGLRRELNEFTDDCYRRSSSRLLRTDSSALTDEQRDSTYWLGSNYFLTTPGYYNAYYAQNVQTRFPFNTARDAGFEADASAGGHPVCTEWWGDTARGLRRRVLDSVDPQVLDDMVYGTGNLVSAATDTALTVPERENVFLRKYLAINRTREALSVDLPMSVGYYDSQTVQAAQRERSDSFWARASGSLGLGYGFVQDVGRAGIAALGGAIKAPEAIGEGYMIRQGMPIFQSLVLMIVIIVLPFLMIFSQYRLATLMTLTIIMFGLHFLNFLWAVAYWMDNNLMSLMTEGGRFGVFEPLANPVQSGILIWTSRLFYLIFPALYLIALGWVGINAGQLINAAEGFGSAVKAPGAAGGAAAKQIATKGKA